MERYSRLWWAAILLSSAVTGGGTFTLLALLTDLPIATVAKISVVFILAGDIALAFLMEALAPTRVKVGPGERRHNHEPPTDAGTVVAAFENGCGIVSVRGERWRARQARPLEARLDAGTAVRVVEREGLTLVVDAAGGRRKRPGRTNEPVGQ